MVDDRPLRVPGRPIRVLYVLAALGALPASCTGSGWVRATLGPSFLYSVVGLALVAWLVWRAIRAMRDANAIARPAGSRLANLLCGVAVVAMAVGVAAFFSTFLVRPITLLVFDGKIRSDSGIEFYLVGIVLVLLTSAGWAGVLLYEAGRLVARAPARARGVLGGSLIAVVLAAPLFVWLAHVGSDEAYRTWAQSCPEPRAPRTSGTAPAGPIAVVLQTDISSEGEPYFAPTIENLLAHPAVEFVERCFRDSCTRYERTGPKTTTAPKSPVEWNVASREASWAWGTRVFDVRQTLRARASGVELTSAEESVFDWGLWRRWRPGDEMRRYEGCGYANREPTRYRLNMHPPSAAEIAYLRTDLDLLAAALPEPLRFHVMAPIPGRDVSPAIRTAEPPPTAREVAPESEPEPEYEPAPPTGVAEASAPDDREADSSLPIADNSVEREPVPPLPEPLAGEAGLQQALARGLIRPAEARDFSGWRTSDARLTKQALERADSMVRIERAFVIGGPFRFPAGLYGAHAAIFVLPVGVPPPVGDPGHSAIFDVAASTCTGALCGR